MNERPNLAKTGIQPKAEEKLKAENLAVDKNQRRLQKVFQNLGVGIPFLVVFLIGIILVPNFLTIGNFSNLLVNASILAIIGYGMTLIVCVRGIDLSVGSMQALIACLMVTVIDRIGVIPGIGAAILLGIVLGGVNAFIIVKLKVPAFIATLATMGIFRGLALLFTNGAPIVIESSNFKAIATSKVMGVPSIALIAVLLAVFIYLLVNRTAYGRHLIAVGGNRESAVDAGVRVGWIEITVYMIGGVLTAIAAVLLSSQLGTVNASLSTGLELQIIAIAVLGGSSLNGGRANIVGSFIAAVLLAMIDSSMNLLNIPSFYQYVALGALLIFALAIDSIRQFAIKRVER